MSAAGDAPASPLRAVGRSSDRFQDAAPAEHRQKNYGRDGIRRRARRDQCRVDRMDRWAASLRANWAAASQGRSSVIGPSTAKTPRWWSASAISHKWRGGGSPSACPRRSCSLLDLPSKPGPDIYCQQSVEGCQRSSWSMSRSVRLLQPRSRRRRHQPGHRRPASGNVGGVRTEPSIATSPT